MFFQEPQSFLKALCKYLIATTPYKPYFGIYVIVQYISQYSLPSLERELEHGKFEGQKIIYITGLEIHILSNIITKKPFCNNASSIKCKKLKENIIVIRFVCSTTHAVSI